MKGRYHRRSVYASKVEGHNSGNDSIWFGIFRSRSRVQKPLDEIGLELEKLCYGNTYSSSVLELRRFSIMGLRCFATVASVS